MGANRLGATSRPANWRRPRKGRPAELTLVAARLALTSCVSAKLAARKSYLSAAQTVASWPRSQLSGERETATCDWLLQN